MDYIGSKLKLKDWIFSILNNKYDAHGNYVFLDACCGSGIMSQYAANTGYKVIANDIMKFPSVIVNGSVGVSDSEIKDAGEYIIEFNKLKGIDGYFYKNFCDKSYVARLYFTEENARIIDNLRQEIDKIKNIKIKNYLLYCGLEAMSRVSNTTGVQAAFLKQFKDRAKLKIKLKPENVFTGNAVSYCKNILDLLQDRDFRVTNKEDILYIDPPYNSRQYGPNYHLYETFVKNDNPLPKGMTGLRNWKEESNSSFCSKRTCLDFLKNTIKNTTAQTVLVSYNSDGILKLEEIKESFPNVIIHSKDQRRYKSDISDSRKYNEKELIEYLFEINI